MTLCKVRFVGEIHKRLQTYDDLITFFLLHEMDDGYQNN